MRRAATMRKSLAGLLGLAAGLWLVPAATGAAIEPGTMVDQSNADEVKDLLPPEIYKHFKNGDYMNKLVDFPNSKWAGGDGFDEDTKWNGEHIVLHEHRSPLDESTRKRHQLLPGMRRLKPG